MPFALTGDAGSTITCLKPGPSLREVRVYVQWRESPTAGLPVEARARPAESYISNTCLSYDPHKRPLLSRVCDQTILHQNAFTRTEAGRATWAGTCLAGPGSSH